MLERDAVERSMGKSVQEMDHDELIKYLKLSMKSRWGLDLPATDYKEVAIMKAYKSSYGPAAGEIIKYVFEEYDGKCSGSRVTIYDFTKGHRWWVDRMYLEMQEKSKLEAEKSDLMKGFLTLDRLRSATQG